MYKKIILALVVFLTTGATLQIIHPNSIHRALAVSVDGSDHLSSSEEGNYKNIITITNTGPMNIYIQSIVTITGDQSQYDYLLEDSWKLVSKSSHSNYAEYTFLYLKTLHTKETTHLFKEIHLLDNTNITMTTSIQAIESRFFKNSKQAFEYY